MEEQPPLSGDVGEEVAGLDCALDGEAGGGDDGVGLVCVPVSENFIVGGQEVGQGGGDQKRRGGQVRGGEGFCYCHHVGGDVGFREGLIRVEMVGRGGGCPAHSAHHLVVDQEDAVGVAERFYTGEVTRYRGDTAEGSADNGFED